MRIVVGFPTLGTLPRAYTPMKLHFNSARGIHLITARGRGFIEVNRTQHTTSLLLMADSIRPWALSDIAALTRESASELVALHPELVLIGTGERHQFPAPDSYRDLIEAGIGVEIMSTDAACRTYNFLASEGRQVLAALIVETTKCPEE